MVIIKNTLNKNTKAYFRKKNHGVKLSKKTYSNPIFI